MNYLALIRMFGGPIGTLVNKVIFAGGTLLTGWAVSKGADAGLMAQIVGPLTMAASAIVDSLLGTQTAAIQKVNDGDNGVKVVPANAPAKEVNAPLA